VSSSDAALLGVLHIMRCDRFLVEDEKEGPAFLTKRILQPVLLASHLSLRPSAPAEGE
jgi:hypothetical protein